MSQPPPPPPPLSPESWEIGPADLRAFVGPRADYYLERFARFHPGGVDRFVVTWNWAAFLGGFWWFLYRRMYVYFLIALFGAMVPYAGLVVWFGGALAGNYLYYGEVRRRVRDIKAAAAGRDALPALREAGGVHGWVPWVAALVTGAVVLILALFGLGSMLMLTGAARAA